MFLYLFLFLEFNMLTNFPFYFFFVSSVCKVRKKKLSVISSYDMSMQFLSSVLLVCVCPLRIFELVVGGGLGCLCDLAWLLFFLIVVFVLVHDVFIVAFFSKLSFWVIDALFKLEMLLFLTFHVHLVNVKLQEKIPENSTFLQRH